jgi:hypothetical protein
MATMISDGKRFAELRFVKIQGEHYGHAYSDKKPATRFGVYVDNTKIGEINSYSSESWATSGRIRTRMLGYTRGWFGTLTGEKHLSWRRCDAQGRNRKSCAEELHTAWKEAQK